MGTVTAEEAERIRAAAESQGDSSNIIPGQTTIGDPDEPHDDPESPGWANREEFVAEAGESVGAMPPREMNGGDVVYVEEIRIDGTTQTALDLGGKRAASATCTLSGKVTVDGSLRKGDVLMGTFRAVVRGAGSKDKVDKQTGIVTEAAEKFTAELVDLELD
jgi:hypothetical protein